jgi:hypothetical protein
LKEKLDTEPDKDEVYIIYPQDCLRVGLTGVKTIIDFFPSSEKDPDVK